MKKYLKIWWRVLKISLMIRMMYKVDWIVALIGNVVYVGVYFLLISFLYEAGGITTLMGFGKYEVLLVVCLSEMMMYIAFINVIPSVHRLANDIYSGRLDMQLMKPVNYKIYSWMQNSWLPDAIGTVLINTILFAFYYRLGGFNFDLETWLLIIFVMILSFFVYSLIFFISSLVWFFWPKFGALRWMIGNTYDANKYPRKVFAGWMQVFLLFVFPVLWVVNPVYDVIHDEFGWFEFELMFLVILVLFGLYYWMFAVGLRRYESVA